MIPHNKLTQETFIIRSNQKHNNKYKYDKVTYCDSKTKITITCPIHGDFDQQAGSHLKGFGCNRCKYPSLNSDGQSFSSEYFISLCNLAHKNKYNYSKVEYKSTLEKIIIICPEHGEFEQKASSHLYAKSGCPKCKNSQGENKIRSFLKSNNIEFTEQYSPIDCINPDTMWKLKFDFYLPKYNLCIEYDGIHHFKPVSFGSGRMSSAKEKLIFTQYSDKLKTGYCKRNNINLLRIQYTKFKNIDSILYHFFGLPL